MLKAKHKTGLVFFPSFDWAISPTHPEREERLLYTQDQVFEEGLLDIDGIIDVRPPYLGDKRVKKDKILYTEWGFGYKEIGYAVCKKIYNI